MVGERPVVETHLKSTAVSELVIFLRRFRFSELPVRQHRRASFGGTETPLLPTPSLGTKWSTPAGAQQRAQMDAKPTEYRDF